MLVLAMDSSAVAASAAVVKDGVILGEFFVNIKQTHSETLMPMVEKLLNFTKLKPSDFDIIAVTPGPGSFTGVRIGVSCAKGLAMPANIPCVPVSSLEAIAYGASFFENKIICSVMDARCGQVYNALFKVANGEIVRLCKDRAISIVDLKSECEKYGSELILAGDGARICYDSFKEFGAKIIGENLRFTRASSVAMAAVKLEKVTPLELVPTYLRIPQAERELKKHLEEKE